MLSQAVYGAIQRNIPFRDGPMEERVLKYKSLSRRMLKLKTIDWPSPWAVCGDVILMWDRHPAAADLVEKSESWFLPPGFQWFPSKLVQHSCDAGLKPVGSCRIQIWLPCAVWLRRLGCPWLNKGPTLLQVWRKSPSRSFRLWYRLAFIVLGYITESVLCGVRGGVFLYSCLLLMFCLLKIPLYFVTPSLRFSRSFGSVVPRGRPRVYFPAFGVALWLASEVTWPPLDLI